jgi:hypothetical protein
MRRSENRVHEGGVSYPIRCFSSVLLALGESLLFTDVNAPEAALRRPTELSHLEPAGLFMPRRYSRNSPYATVPSINSMGTN